MIGGFAALAVPQVLVVRSAKSLICWNGSLVCVEIANL